MEENVRWQGKCRSRGKKGGNGAAASCNNNFKDKKLSSEEERGRVAAILSDTKMKD